MTQNITSSASIVIVLGLCLGSFVPSENENELRTRGRSFNNKQVSSGDQDGLQTRHRRVVDPKVIPWWVTTGIFANKLCPPLKSESLELKCMFGGAAVPCGRPMRPGTKAVERCRYFYNAQCQPEAYTLTCLDTGAWDSPLYYCLPDEVCKRDEDTKWTWKTMSRCPKALEGLRKGALTGPCTSTEDPYICCRPDVEDSEVQTVVPRPPVRRKSAQMCLRYSEYVLKPNKVDTCALTEPIAAPVDRGSGHTPVLSSNIGPREFPHTAVLGFGEKSYLRPGARCAGSLVSERFVLSVASCVDSRLGPATWVRLGDYNVNSNLDDTNGVAQSVVYDIEEIIKHPEYSMYHDVNEIFYHDIALYRLSVDVQFNEYIRPICLHDGNSFMNTFAITTGWGPVEVGERPSDVVQKVNVTIVADGECSDAYKFYGEVKDGLDTDLVVCAALVDGRDTCISIPGSPLQLRLRDPYCMYSLVGVAYFGRNCFVKSPGVYIRISHYLDWIEGVVWP